MRVQGPMVPGDVFGAARALEVFPHTHEWPVEVSILGDSQPMLASHMDIGRIFCMKLCPADLAKEQTLVLEGFVGHG